MLKNLRLVFVLLLICGVAYPVLMTGLAQLTMPAKAEGSLIKDQSGKLIGSEMIGQSFQDPRYFQGRVSSIEYDAANSGTLNYSPSNEELIDRTKKDISKFLEENPTVDKADIPSDLMTNSGSGLDPNISPDSAKVQVPRIAHERELTIEKVYLLVKKYTRSRSMGLFGEPRINVLELNMALDQLK
ncbi:potassium-transporting ATPase subunit KdpC [Peribacillus muralis]|uniref:potassium-transporting ATPase subunit KdpC n=1 Tax=Peribacillus muralis TaxID=264697 RepID=UPI0037F125F5